MSIEPVIAGSDPSSADASSGSGDRKRSKIIIVLPAYNEAAGIGTLLEKVDQTAKEASLSYQVLVVDDGSSDETGEVVQRCASRLPVSISRHERNLGLGCTIRDGLLLAAEISSGDDIIITMDADATHTPGLMLRMVGMIREGHDVVIASRYRPGSRVFGVPVGRRILSSGASWLFRIVFPTPGVRDFTCGYRAYRAAMLKNALARYGSRLVDADGFQCMIDILLKFRAMNAIFGEAPLILRYDLKQGRSKMNVGRTIRQTLWLMVRRRLGR